jgi:hypothetical protein
MPHIEIKGELSPARIHADFKSASARRGGRIYKLRESYLRRDEREGLVEALVVEAHLKQDFLVHLRPRPGGLMLRLYPGTPVQRTAGIRGLLVWFARGILAAYPGLAIGATNLEAELQRDEALG